MSDHARHGTFDSAKQYGLPGLLILTMVPAVLVLTVKGLARQLEPALGGIGATAVYLLMEAILLPALIVFFTRREGLFSWRVALPYQARMAVLTFLLAFAAATAWSIGFRDLVQIPGLGQVSSWARAVLSFWPPEILSQPSRAFPLEEGVDPARAIALYALLALAYGTASFGQTLYFRGFVLPRMERFGWWAPVLNTVLFAAFHLSSPWFWPQFFVFTLMWGVVTFWSRNMWPAILSHVVFNTYWFAWQIAVLAPQL